MRSDADDAARRAYLGVNRATLVTANDGPKMQELTVRNRFGERVTNVEHWSPAGFSHVPMPPDGKAEAEVLIAHLGGSPDHPVVIATADRRSRPKNLKEGDTVLYGKYAGTEITIDGDDVLIMRESDILAVVNA